MEQQVQASAALQDLTGALAAKHGGPCGHGEFLVLYGAHTVQVAAEGRYLARVGRFTASEIAIHGGADGDSRPW
jgi:hypothetical protein